METTGDDKLPTEVALPFSHDILHKQRPAATVSSRAYSVAKPDVVIMAITSQVHSLPAQVKFN